MQLNAYLAGPDVFFPNAVQIGEKKKDFLSKLGIKGHFPLDNIIPSEVFSHPKLAAKMIADANEKIMDDICSGNNFGIIFVNMKPFHGPSMDCGTAFETGCMSALSKQKSVLIIGYTSDERLFEERVIQDIYKDSGIIQVGGIKYGPDGNMIEEFGLADNLMITSAIERTGGKIFTTFEEAALYALHVCSDKDNINSELLSQPENTIEII